MISIYANDRTTIFFVKVKSVMLSHVKVFVTPQGLWP